MFFAAIKYTLALVVFFLFLYFFIKTRTTKPALPVSSRLPFTIPSWVMVREWHVAAFFFIALFFMLIALANPQWSTQESAITKSDIPREGSAFFLLIDVSSSMEEKVSDVKKIDLTKQAAQEFIEGSDHARDLIGLATFARACSVVSPLTLDHNALLQKLGGVTPVTSENVDGTSIGYALFKTINLFIATKYYAEKEQKSLFSIHNAAIIIFTDALQSPHPHDKDHPFRFIRTESALQYAKQNGLRVYVIEVDPIMNSAQFRQENDRLRQYVAETGGELFIAQDNFPVTKILESIEKEQGVTYLEARVQKKPVYESFAPVCLAFACLFFGVAVLLETLVVRQVP